MSGLAKDIHTFSVALGQAAFGLAQLAYYTSVFSVEGVQWMMGYDAPDRSQEVPLESRLIDGRPVVRWLADEGNDFGESFSGYSVFEAVVTFQYHATIDDNGLLVVTRQSLYGEYRWKPSDGSPAEDSSEGMAPSEPDITVICSMPADQLRSFTVETDMGDLSAARAAKVRASRQWFTEHQCIRASFDGGETGILSLCQRGAGHTRQVVYQLTRMFAGAKSARGSLPQAPRPPVAI